MKSNKIIAIVAVAWLLIVIIIVVAIVLTNRREEPQHPTLVTPVAIEQPTATPVESEEEVVVVESNFTTQELTLETVYTALYNSGVSSEACDVISYSLTYFPVTYSTWLLQHNQGYCDVFYLLIDESETPTCTTMCFMEDVYVTYNATENKYVFCKDGTNFVYSKLHAESYADMLRRGDSNWNWNEFEAIAVAGLVDMWFPNQEEMFTDDIIVTNSGYVQFSRAALIVNEDRYSLYEHVVSDDAGTEIIPEDWHIGTTLGYDALAEWLTANDLDHPVDLEKFFTENTMTVEDYWSAEIVSQKLIIYSIRIRPQNSKGYERLKVFEYDYGAEVYKKYR